MNPPRWKWENSPAELSLYTVLVAGINKSPPAKRPRRQKLLFVHARCLGNRIVWGSKNTEAFEKYRELEPRISGLIVRAHVFPAWPIRIALGFEKYRGIRKMTEN